MTATPDDSETRPAATQAVGSASARGAPAERSARQVGSEKDRDMDRELTVALRRAFAVLLWERVWPVLVALGAAIGLFLIVSWLGLWLVLPAYGRMAGIVVFAVLIGIALVPALRIRPPTSPEALGRLDRESRQPHRPATALADHLASRPDDPVGTALWRAHLQRMSAQAGQLRTGLPAPGVAARDPKALRALVILGVIATFFMVPGDHMRRIEAAFDWHMPGFSPPYRVDAWVTPPAYTARAPVMLPGLHSQDNAGAVGKDDGTGGYEATAIAVPGGSELVVRITGLDDARLVTEGDIRAIGDANAGDGAAGSSPPAATRRADVSGQERRFIVAGDGSARIEAPDGRIVSWHFRAQPDAPPTIELTREPQASGTTGLILHYKAEDDYGVAGAQARFVAVPPPAPLHALSNAPPPSAPRPLVEAPDFALPLGGGRKRVATGQTTHDFTESPWAGTRVTMTLVAKDDAGNMGASHPRSFVLPQRRFTNPLARALVEQRRVLALDANQRGRVLAGLDALAIAPERFMPNAAHYMGLRSAYWRLANARSDDDLRGVVDYLWEIAVRIEDGDLSDIEKRLRDAQQALQKALDSDAGDEEIQRLTQELREAMQEFMQALAEEAQRNGPMAGQQPMDPNTRSVRPEDLQNMLNRIEDMARNGSRDAARQMLSELQNMLNGLQAGRQQSPRQGQSQMSQAMDELGDMVRRQQQLRDRTFREGRQPGEPEGEGQQQGAFNELRQNQEQLREQLRQLRERMQQAMRERGQQGEAGQQSEAGQQGEGQQGEGQPGGSMPGDGGFAEAEQAMREAEQALREGDGTGAVDAQSEALQALRRGAQQMAEAMQPQQGQQGLGQGMPSGPGAERTDPLGRPLRSRDYGDDSTVKVPEEIDMQRARRVLEELRRRFGEPERPRLELDYLERLLKDF